MNLLMRTQLYLFLCLTISFSSLTISQTQQPGNPLADETPAAVFEKDAVYSAECGSCHIPYPPMLLPSESWHKLMSGLDKHFGDNAELDNKTTKHITAYLHNNALEQAKESIVGHWLATIPANPPLRVTELKAFVKDHEDAYRRLGLGSEETGFFSPCKDCHKEAEDGIFDKDRLFRGMGHVFQRFSGGKKSP